MVDQHDENTESKVEPENQKNDITVGEVTSTTLAEQETTKRTIRMETWKKIKEGKYQVRFTYIFNRIPVFNGHEVAANLLTETEEFKNACNIKVNSDRAQEAVKLLAISAGKNLFVMPQRGVNAIYSKISCPSDADNYEIKKAIKVWNSETRTNIALEDYTKLDMLVIGSVAVSKDGHRIGRGMGFIDLDIGMLIHIGAVTPETLIVTTVHSTQVYDSLPEDLFGKHDVPVDMIVTEKEVIRVPKIKKRPSGIFWELISERRLNILSTLRTIKENEEKAGKIIVLKAEDTDVESFSRNRRFTRKNYHRNFQYPRFRRNRSVSRIDNQEQKIPRLRKKRFVRGRRPKSEDDQSSNEINKENNKENIKENNKDDKISKRRPKERRFSSKKKSDFCIKVFNITRDVRVKDLKTELRKRNCKPIYIAWKGFHGKCFLHFAKPADKKKEEEIEEVLEQLKNLSLEISNEKDKKVFNLNVELIQLPDKNDRIESVDTSAV